ncbi:MAG: 16S rRNA (cytosine(1402)-N(4))-methyltransferase RsmH [Alphaproteobacteria bacterium]|nr:16S rRNA (cytosine(1402)-N(4))-methyltransferase RsmH [Alphaproteobacteria bacterium]
MNLIPHIPVLLEPVIQHLKPQGGVFIDGTFGAGGYTRAILLAHPKSKVIAFDRDPSVDVYVKKVKDEFGARFNFIQDCFSNMALHIHKPVDGIVLDIGVSSMQIDQPTRGFSLRFDGPLDMRMGNTGPTAAEIIQSLPEKKLAELLFKYGEEKCSRRIAHALKKKLPQTTLQMAEVIHAVMPRPKDGSDSATRSFQALRIFVNDELGELERTLAASVSLLKPQGRLVVVSFHSLEDRIVKDFLNQNSEKSGHVNKYAKTKQAEGAFRILTKKPVTAGEDELKNNPRAHSAKLRAAIRTESTP